jgi:hypothetical protein
VRISIEEQAAILGCKEDIHVIWQDKSKAYVDSYVELEILENCYLPFVKRETQANGGLVPDFLLQQDNFKPHKSADALRYLKEQRNTYSLFAPSEQTPFVQMVDDNCGKLLRHDAYLAFDDWEYGLDLDDDSYKKPTASQQRQLLYGFVSKAVQNWEIAHLEVGLRAAQRYDY